MTASILIVEDEEPIQILLTYNLQAEGFRVRATANGEDVAHLVNEERPDLIVLEDMKPEIYLETPDLRKLAQSDPITFQLLGGYRDIDTPPWALQTWAEKHGVQPPAVPWFVEET